MKFRGRTRDEPEIILIPLIDILLMLLIFFMLSTTFDNTADLKVQLPEASAAKSEKEPDRLEVVIDAKGQFFLNHQQVISADVDRLVKAIRREVGDRKDMPAVIRADATASYQSVVTVLDALGQAGLTKISLPTAQAQPKPNSEQ